MIARPRVLRLLAGLWLLAGGGVVLRSEIRLSKVDADRMQSKLVLITQFAEASPRARPLSRSTAITEPEVNSYLRFSIADLIPTGVVEPYITIVGDGRLAGRALVDLDAVRNQKDRGWLDPIGHLSGRLPVTLSGILHARDGAARFDLESAQIAGVPVPKFVLQELVSHYTRTAEKPGGLGLDDTFELPAGIREIRVGRGEAIVVQ